MKKYVVICYAVHKKEIASHDAFDNEDDAYTFLEKDAQNTYDDEINNASEVIDFLSLENNRENFINSLREKIFLMWFKIFEFDGKN